MKTTSIGPIRIRFFNTPVRYFYYELYLLDGSNLDETDEDRIVSIELDNDQQNRVTLLNQLSPKKSNTIQFVYKNEVLVKRQLNQIEVQKVVENIKKINPVIQLIPEEDSYVLPDISHEIQVESYRLTYSYTWSSSDALSCPKQLKKIIDLSELIESLIDVDYAGLDMPMYL